MAGVGSNLFNGLPFGRTSVFAVPLLTRGAEFSRGVCGDPAMVFARGLLREPCATAALRPNIAFFLDSPLYRALGASSSCRDHSTPEPSGSFRGRGGVRACRRHPGGRVLNAIAALVTLAETDSRGARLATILGSRVPLRWARGKSGMSAGRPLGRGLRALAFAMISGFIGAQVLLYVGRLSTKDTQTGSECPSSRVVVRREGPAHR